MSVDKNDIILIEGLLQDYREGYLSTEATAKILEAAGFTNTEIVIMLGPPLEVLDQI